MKNIFILLISTIFLSSCGGAKKGDPLSLVISSGALTCTTQETPDIPASCSAQADIYRQEQGRLLGIEIAYDSLHGISINQTARRLAISNGALAIEQSCYQSAGSPTKKIVVCPSNDNIPTSQNNSQAPASYGYIYLNQGDPYVPSIVVQINGALVPQSSVNGWEYLGLQFTSSLDSTLRVVDLPTGSKYGYFIRLNGTYQFGNSSEASNSIIVNYTSK